MPKIKTVNSKQFVRLAKKFRVSITQEQIKALNNGDILAKKINEETGEETIYVLHEIYIKKYYKKYSSSHSSKGGSELLISNFELPRGPVII